MSLQRILFVILVGLVPLALLRGLWWSDLLFGRPWFKDREALDFGQFQALSEGWAVAGLVLVLGFFLFMVIDGFISAFQVWALPVLLAGSGVIAALWVLVHPTLGAQGFWPLLGFTMIVVVWLFATLQLERRL